MIHRMIHNIMNIKAAVTYVPYQDLENKVLLAGLLDTPEDFLPHIRRFTYSLSTQMIYGYRCIDNKDPKLLQLFNVSQLPARTPRYHPNTKFWLRALKNGPSSRGTPVPSWPTSSRLCKSSRT